MKLFDALFAPRGIALVGASADPAKNTARPQRLLRKYGYGGRVLPINPGRREVLGEPAYASLAEAPGEIDHAFVMLGAAQVESVIEQCAARGVPVATIFSDGFAEAGGEGVELQRRLVLRAKELGVRLLGPNCIGLVNFANGAVLTVNSMPELDLPPPGHMSVVSQSGSMLGTLISRGAAHGMGFAKLISVGNEADIGVGELVDMLVDDPDTRVILLFLEGIRDAESLARAARRAHAAGKPIVAYKLGRSALGQELALSHTGALAGSDAATDAYFRRLGIVRVDFVETLIEIAPLLCNRRPAPPGGSAPRVAVVTTTGGGAASVVDRLGTLGVQTMTPDAPFIADMAAQGIALRPTPIIDTTMAGSSQSYCTVLKALLAHPGCAAVLAVVGTSARTDPSHAITPILEFAGSAKPIAVFLAPHADAAVRLLGEAGVPVFRTPEGCADALAALLSWRAPGAAVGGDAPTWPATLPSRGKLNEAQALSLFASIGVPAVRSALARAPDFAHPLDYPVAAKVLSPDILHKTEVGGVALGLRDAAELQAAAARILETARLAVPTAHIEGVLVQPMVEGLSEVIVGYRHDAGVGPVVMVGMGGQLAEIYRDTALRCAPVDEAEALEMIGEVKGLAVLRGWRGLPPGDLGALARAVAAFSRLALLTGQPVLDAEINPLMVRADGVVAADGLVVLKETR